jgi:hypothetical protein
MWDWVRIAAWSVGSALRSRRDLALENVALRHQLMVLQRQSGRPRLKDRDRLFGADFVLRVHRSYTSYYHSSRTHRSLDNDSPDSRPVEPPEMGDVAALSQVGGLHHRYTRRLAA